MIGWNARLPMSDGGTSTVVPLQTISVSTSRWVSGISAPLATYARNAVAAWS